MYENVHSAFCNFINTQLSLGCGLGPAPGAALADPIDVCALNFAMAVCLDGFRLWANDDKEQMPRPPQLASTRLAATLLPMAASRYSSYFI